MDGLKEGAHALVEVGVLDLISHSVQLLGNLISIHLELR